jgi:hypothetical protein
LFINKIYYLLHKYLKKQNIIFFYLTDIIYSYSMSSIEYSEALYKQTHYNVLREYYIVYIYYYIVFILLSSLFFALVPVDTVYIIITYVLLIILFFIGFPRII